MAAQVFTINPEAFIEALKELPLSSVYAKVSELRNSIAHLHRSNAEMRAFMESSETEAEKREMEGYIRENEGVFKSMEERLGMLRNEIERRGQRWIEEGEIGDGDDAIVKGGRENGNGNGVVNLNGSGRADSTGSQGGENSDEGVYL